MTRVLILVFFYQTTISWIRTDLSLGQESLRKKKEGDCGADDHKQGRHSNQCHRAMALVTFLVSKYQKSRKSRIFLDFIIKMSRSGIGQFSLRLAPLPMILSAFIKIHFLV